MVKYMLTETAMEIMISKDCKQHKVVLPHTMKAKGRTRIYDAFKYHGQITYEILCTESVQGICKCIQHNML